LSKPTAAGVPRDSIPTESSSPALRSGANSAIDVSVLIVNYNTVHLLKEMWDALMLSKGGLNLQTIVVDNASRDESVSVLRRDYPDARLIVNSENVGFGRANNQALSAGADSRYVLLLNTDAFVASDTLTKTVAYMDAHPDCGILGVRLVGRDGELQPSCRYFPTPWNVFLARTGMARFFPKVRMVDDMSWDHASVRECDWVPGCYLLVRRDVIDQVGLFDPRYFLYSEELDHCFAAKRAGWKVAYFPETEVVHIGGESAKSDSELTSGGRQIQVLQIESELLFFRKNHGLGAVLASLLLSTLADVVLATKHLLKGNGFAGLSSYWRHTQAVWRSFARTRGGTVPTR
jgi:N-acetylglucosaminyl-diphospho-decaprenol L-rhamnosyltransferase